MSEHLQYHSDYILNRLARGEPLNESMDAFLARYRQIPIHERCILEAGTCRWKQHVSTHHKKILDPYAVYVMTDITQGEDVDVVADLHQLPFHDEEFNVFWSSSTWEHLHSPWTASLEVLRVLKPGGIFYIQTHLCFPEHGYPNDYMRFTKEGLKSLFRGAKELVASYEYGATLKPHDSSIEWNDAAPCFLNVSISGMK